MKNNLRFPRLSSFVVRAVCLIMLLALFVSALPIPAQAASNPTAALTCIAYHTVKKGETLESIAEKYGVQRRVLARVNDVKDTNDLSRGMQLCIPSAYSSGTTKNASLSISIKAGRILIKGADFPSLTGYIVKVQGGSFGIYFYWYFQVGRVLSDKDGKLKGSFLLPEQLQDEPFVTVCIRNVYTDLQTCRVVRNN